MKLYEFEGKTEEELKTKIFKELNAEEKELIIKFKEEEKNGLFKSKKIDAKVVIIDEVIAFVKEEIKTFTDLMSLPVNLEVKKKENQIRFTLYSDNNAILIGKNGRTLESLQTVIKQSLYTKLGMGINIILDIEDYKEKQQRNLEFLAKKIAKEVRETKVEAKMMDMNSYERRLVHSTLTDYDGIYTESEGQEPNRYIVIKPKED